MFKLFLMIEGMLVVQGADGLVASVNVTQCFTKMIISKISFEGGFSGWVLDLFKSLIVSYTEREINTVSCVELTKLVDNNLTMKWKN